MHLLQFWPGTPGPTGRRFSPLTTQVPRVSWLSGQAQGLLQVYGEGELVLVVHGPDDMSAQSVFKCLNFVSLMLPYATVLKEKR